MSGRGPFSFFGVVFGQAFPRLSDSPGKQLLKGGVRTCWQTKARRRGAKHTRYDVAANDCNLNPKELKL